MFSLSIMNCRESEVGMKKVFLRSFVVLFLTSPQVSPGLHTSCFAATSWNKALTESRRALKKNDFETVRIQALSAVSALEKDSSKKKELAEALSLVGQAYQRQGQLHQAEPYLKRAFDLTEELGEKGQKESVIIVTTMSLGTVYRDLHRFSEAESLYKSVLQKNEGGGPIKKLLRSAALVSLGTLCLDQEKYAEAESYFRQALEVRDSSFLKGYLKEADIWDPLGQALIGQAKLTEAEEYLSKSLKWKEEKYGADSPLIALTAGNLGNVYERMNKLNEALELYVRSLAAARKLYGEKGINVAQLECNRGRVLMYLNRYAEAEEAFKTAIRIHEANLGAGHTDVAADRISLANLFMRQGKYDESERLYSAALAISQSAQGGADETISALSGLGSLYYYKQDYKRSEEYLRKALQLSESHLGAAHDVTSGILTRLGHVLAAEKRYAECLPIVERALSISEKVFGKNSLNLQAELRNVASMLTELGMNDRAANVWQRLIDIKTKAGGGKSPDLAPDLEKLASVKVALGDEEGAEKLRQQALALKRSLPGYSAATAVPTPDISKGEKPGVAGGAETYSIKDKWALVIGISNFKYSNINLRYAAKDATDFDKYLTSYGRFAKDHVKLLTDGEATRENIVKMLGEGWLGKNAAPDDLVVIYISSHGSSSRGEAGGVNFLVAQDTNPNALLSTGIPMQWLTGIIHEQVKSRKVVLVLDVCHSGAAARPTAPSASGDSDEADSAEAGSAQSSEEGDKQILRSFEVKNVEIGSGQLVICSSLPDEVSWESKSYDNSVFTRKLIDSLKLRNGNIKLKDAFENLKEEVSAEVLRDRGQLQTPVLQANNWNGGDPILSVVPKSAKSMAK